MNHSKSHCEDAVAISRLTRPNKQRIYVWRRARQHHRNLARSSHRQSSKHQPNKLLGQAIKEINSVTRQSSRQTATSLISDSKRKLGRLAVDFTWWNEAIDNVILQFDPD